MAFALVHFTVGFVAVLAVVSALGVTRYRSTAAYVGGILALCPDAHHLVDGAFGRRIRAFHDGPQADVFFLHGALDAEVVRAHNVEFTFLSLAVLGVAFVVYDGRFAPGGSTVRVVDGAEESDETAR